jgi:hypothetical protein
MLIVSWFNEPAVVKDNFHLLMIFSAQIK